MVHAKTRPLVAPQAAAHRETPQLVARAPLLQARILAHRSFAPAATAFVSELAVAYRCLRVSIGFIRRDAIRLAAVSGGGHDKMDGAEYDAIADAMDEARQQDASVCLPRSSQARSLVTIAHQRLRRRHGCSVLTVPLMAWGEPVGAVTFEWTDPRFDAHAVATELETTVNLVAPILELMRQRERPVWVRGLEEVGRIGRSIASRPHTRIAAGVAAVILVTVVAIPLPHRVGGNARIEGQQQRTLAAPADGYLKSVHVRPGDAVRRGQLLVEMADDDLILRSRRWESEAAQQEHAYSTALATQDRSAMVIALARADQARTQLALVEADLDRSAIVAPFDGVILQGDLSQSIGAPFERGKALLLLTPDDQQRVVIHVDERDIGRVAVGQPATLALSALPWDTIDLTVIRVTPIARLDEGRNGFEVEARIAADDAARVRPGLQGVARIEVGHAPLGWIWTHRLIDRLRLAWWRWQP